MMSTPAHTAHDLLRAAAAAFARLRRSPGRGETWPQPVLRALERDRPATYGRLRRRLGLSQRLATLAGLGPAERATIALACLFREVADDTELTSRTAGRAWNEYFLRHETWLAPCFAIAETLRVADWPEDESLASVVGRMAYRFDIATLDEQRRPLHVLEELPDSAQSKLEETVVLLLLSESGQELCDHHFRRQAGGYKPPLAEIARSIVALRPRASVRPMPPEAITAAPLRLSGSAMKRRPAPQPKPRSQEEQAPRPAAAAARQPDNFEQRRLALRSLHAARGGDGTPPPAAREEPEAPIERVAAMERPAAVEEALRYADVRARLRAPEPIEEQEPIHEPAPIERVAAMERPAAVEEALRYAEVRARLRAPEPIEEQEPIDEPAPIERVVAMERPAAVEEALRYAEVRARLRAPEPIEGQEPIDEPAPIEDERAEEDNMEKIRAINSARGERPDHPDFVAKLEEVQLRLQQIERVAEEGQRLLAELGPQLQDLAGWMADLESMVGRWRGERSIEERVA